MAGLVVGGLAIGAVYALMALAYVILIKTMDLINFAIGQLAMVGAYLGLYLYVFHKVPFIVAFGAALAATAILSVMMYSFTIRPLAVPTLLNMVTATIASSIILQNSTIIMTGARTFDFPSPVGDSLIELGKVRIVPSNVLILACALLLMGGFFIFFKKSRPGLALRAIMNDREMAELMGIRMRNYMLLAFTISGMLAAASGILIAPMTYVHINMPSMALKAFTSAVIGGLYSVTGSMLGGLLLGVLETFMAVYVSSAYKDVFVYSAMILLLLVRPQGIWGD